VWAAFPSSDIRADYRSAFHSALIMSCNATSELSDDEFNQMVRSMSVFLKCDDTAADDDAVDLTALAKVKQKEQQWRGSAT
jgi:hypothetical protein